MSTLRDALKKAQLVDEKQAERAELRERAHLCAAEAANTFIHGGIRVFTDAEDAKAGAQRIQQAAREATKPSSRVGTKDYYDRFKK